MPSGPALAALFATHGTEASCRAGAPLYLAGDKADSLYRVEAGRLAVFRPGEEGRTRPLGIVGRGEIVGEMALLRASPRSTTVIALCDSRLRRIGADQLFAEAERNPLLWRDLAAIALMRMRDPDHPVGARPARVIGLSAVSPSVDPHDAACRIAAALRQQGSRAAVIPEGSPAEAIDAGSQAHDHLLIPAACGPGASGRLPGPSDFVEQWLLLADPADPLPPAAAAEARPGLLFDLLLVPGAGGAGQPARWASLLGPRRLFTAALGKSADVARIARRLRHADVGLVLSGGGARAFAHIGAVRALREAGVPIDSVAGTSMGALVAAAVACDWPDEEVDARMRDAFVATSPLDDIAFPMIAMTRGGKVERRLERHFGSRLIESLALPFFCVSANLTRGTPHCHDRGLLAPALRASISLPGILPPVVADGEVLVDGGVLRNLPTDLMRQRHDGRVLAIDVSRARGLSPEQIAMPPSMARWVIGGSWRCGPPIVSILMRSATLASRVEQDMARTAADVVVQPELGAIEIRDWKAYPQAVAAGYAAMRAALEAGGGLEAALTPARPPGATPEADAPAAARQRW